MKKIKSILSVVLVIGFLAMIPGKMVFATEVQVGGQTYNISNKFNNDEIPDGYKKATMQYDGQGISILQSGDEEVTLVYLTDADGENGEFYRYDEENNTFSVFVQINTENSYLIISDPPQDFKIPAGFTETTLEIDGKSVKAWYEEDTTKRSEFYLVYGINNKKTESLYRYDTQEETFQRYIEEIPDTAEIEALTSEREALNTQVAKLENDLAAAKDLQFKLLCAMGGLALVLVIIIINLSLKIKRNKISKKEKAADQDAGFHPADSQKPEKSETRDKETELAAEQGNIELTEEIEENAETAIAGEEQKQEIPAAEQSFVQPEKAAGASSEPEAATEENHEDAEMDVPSEPEIDYDNYDDFELEILDLDSEE